MRSSAGPSTELHSAVEKGVVEALHEGILGGFPVVDLRVTLYDGSYHDVDSSEMAFKIAASWGSRRPWSKRRRFFLSRS